MLNYQDVAEGFDFASVANGLLSGSVEQLNAAYECCDRHAIQDPNKVALYWQGKDGRKEQYTFSQLQKWSSQFAIFLKSQGVQRGDRVSGLLPRTPELLVVILGAWRIVSV